MHLGVLGHGLTFLPQPYHLLSGSRSSPSSSLLGTRPRQGLIAPHAPRNYLALVLPKNVQATATPRETTALFAAMDAKHPPDKHPKLQGNLWVYVGNLDWELPVAQVESALRAFFVTLPAVSEGKTNLGESVAEVDIAFFGQGYKRKPRDEGKEHGGFALLRFETPEEATAAILALDGGEIKGAGARGTLRASLARSRIDKGEEERRLAAERKEAKERKLQKQREHNVRQRRAVSQRYNEELAKIIQELPHPGGMGALSSWRQILEAPPGQDSDAPAEGMDSSLAGNGLVDWDAMHLACDPARGGGLHFENVHRPKRAKVKVTDAKSTARMMRKRWQVESFLCILQRLAPAPASGETPQQRPLIVDFGCGTGNLALPLASLMPYCDFVGVDMKGRSIELFNDRARAAGLTNAKGVVGMIEDFKETFDIALALHACGSATDFAIESALTRKAAFVVNPCCIGKLKASIGQEGGISHPRSDWLRRSLQNPTEDFAILARAADISHTDTIPEGGDTASEQAEQAEESVAGAGPGDGRSGEREKMARISKLNVELDRSECAKERGYKTVLLKILHPEASTKNDMIVGAPDGKFAGGMKTLQDDFPLVVPEA